MKKILAAGEGGQGVQSIVEILALSLHQQGKFVSYMPNFGVEQRGGVSLGFLQIDDKKISYPKFSLADIIIALSDRAIPAVANFIKDNTIFIYDSSSITDDNLKNLQGKFKNYLNIPAQKIANDQSFPKSANIIILGAILKYIEGLDPQKVKTVMSQKFAKYLTKNPQIADQNNRAFNFGLEFSKNPTNQEFRGKEKKEIQNVFEDEKKSWQRIPEYCKSCGLCLVRCPECALTYSNDLNFLGTPMPQNDLEKCTACGICQKVCPEGALIVKTKTPPPA